MPRTRSFVGNTDPVRTRLLRKKSDLAAQIDHLRRSHYGWTRRELAERAGMDEAQLSKLLALESNPTLETIVRLEDALGYEILMAPVLLDLDVTAPLAGKFVKRQVSERAYRPVLPKIAGPNLQFALSSEPCVQDELVTRILNTEDVDKTLGRLSSYDVTTEWSFAKTS